MSAATLVPDPATSPVVELAELAGGFVHEIKNHLSALTLNLQLLAEDFSEPESQRERRAHTRLTRLKGECDRLLDLSNDFLRFAKLEPRDRRTMPLGQLVEEMVDFFAPTARQAQIEIVPHVPADLPPVRVDADQFKQALLNLMLNAEQAMPQGGTLTMQACREPGYVRLDLIDTGHGMPADVAARVFKPFYTTKPGGTGLGLPTTKKIVEAHGGRIAVESAAGRGTKFTVWLPVEVDAPPIAPVDACDE